MFGQIEINLDVAMVMGSFALMITGFYALLRFYDNRWEKREERWEKRDAQHIAAIRELSKVTAANTNATRSADNYLRERNGRDAEFWTEARDQFRALTDLITAVGDRNLKAYRHINEQHVDCQYVDKEQVKKKT